ncbi:MAG: CoA transferase [Actinomycetota bacterium]
MGDNMSDVAEGMLAPYRVIDLTDGPAELSAFMFAGLGADVIKVEPPGGNRSRYAAPLAEGEPDGLASLAFHAWNRGKRSVVLDLDDVGDRERFLELVESADFLFEDAGPGKLDTLGLGAEVLRSRQPELIHVAISPYGQDGPYADFLATDLTLAAMGGQMAVTGDPDRRPVRITVPQTWLHASAEAALGAMAAHHRRLTTGEGQFVDMSVQTAVFWTGLNAMIRYAIDGKNNDRVGTELHLATMSSPLVQPAADGEVCMLPTGATLQGLLPWMLETGAVTQEWVDAEDWETHERRRLDGDPLVHGPEVVLETVQRFTEGLTKAELFAGGVERGITLMPVQTASDVVAMEHLEVREYWEDVTLPSGRVLKAPGPFVKSSVAPVTWERGAPALGEHTDEVLSALSGASNSAPGPVVVTGERGLPLEGLKVVDFAWIGVGPITGKSLADHGATVVRVEAEEPPDRLRLVGPFTDGEIGINRCQFFGSFNTSKKSLHLNLKHPAGIEVAKQLLTWCDVALDSFVAGTLNRLGLGYDVARELNPGIVMVETCLFGQTGPCAPLAGYGYHAASISGFYEVTGWDDRAPGGPWNAYTDTIAPRFLTTAIYAALDHRRRTGEGQYIDQAQMESALHFLGPQLLDVQVSGTSARRSGNFDAERVPHNSFPCAGDDQWCAIAIESAEQWAALCRTIGAADWADDAACSTAEQRRDCLDEIEARISEWTREHDPQECMRILQAAGVPAGAMQRSSDTLADPQLAHRNFFRPMMHPEMGEVPYEGHQYRIAGYDNGPIAPAPCLGEHTFEVLTEILGIDTDEAVTILGSGACG